METLTTFGQKRMFVKESEWIARQLIQLADEKKIKSLLNVGSSTGYFREVMQPFINKNIFNPLNERGIKVVHLDMKKDEGVDLVGDLMDEEFFNQLKSYDFDCFLCSNVLEHVMDPYKVTRRMADLAKSGSYLLITVPSLYPYCNDPMDNNLRPTVNELAAMFPGTELVAGAEIDTGANFFKMLMEKPRVFVSTFGRLFLPFYKSSSWKYIWRDYFNMFKNFKTSCVLLKKV